MSRYLALVLVSASLLLTACGGGGGGGAGGGGETVTVYSRVAKSALPPGDLTCTYGGILVKTGFDIDGDLVLDANEVVDSEKVCNGAPGSNGANGVESLVRLTDLAAGGMCVSGGEQIDAGTDDNSNGVLDIAEIDRTAVVCNGLDGLAGADGSNGLDGLTTLLNITTQGASATCPAGGQRIDTGLDTDDDGVLDVSEIVKWELVCNGVDGAGGADGATGSSGIDALLAVASEPPGINCATGGQQVQTGPDLDDDGVLDTGEISATRYVCNGAAGANGLNSLVSVNDEAAGVNCAVGGKKIETGLDDDRDGTLDSPAEVDSTAYVCTGNTGTSGLNSLVLITTEPAGANCPAGGSRIDTGLDDDRDNVLDVPGEIDSTSYVCSSTFPTLSVTETHDELCLHGATVLKSGLDLDLDTMLDAAEVTATSTICQNNAAPSIHLRHESVLSRDPYTGEPIDTVELSSWHGLPLDYNAATRTWSVSLYNDGALFAFNYSDPNEDAVNVELGASPAVTTTFLPDYINDMFGVFGFDIAVLNDIPGGVYDIPLTIDDTEATKAYTLHLDVRELRWTFTPTPATEGVDTWATGTVTIPQPLLSDMTLTGAEPWIAGLGPMERELVCAVFNICGSEASPLEICIDGEPCVAASSSTPQEFCNDELFGYPICVDVYPATQIVLPAGTTSFTIRRPIGDDGVWGAYNNLAHTLNLHAASVDFPPLAARFSVVDNDPAPTVSFVDILFPLASGDNAAAVQVQSSQTDVLIPLLFSGTAVDGLDYALTGLLNGWVSIGADGFGTFQVNPVLNEALTETHTLDIAFDTLFGVVPGTNPTAQVTIAPPPPLSVGFVDPAWSISRYQPYTMVCVPVVLNRLSFIQQVSFEVAVTGGNAATPGDYNWLDTGPFTIEAGSNSTEVCLDLNPQQNLDDVTLELTLINIDGAGAGANPAHTLTITGGELPSVDFTQATNIDLMDTGVNDTCATLELSGAMPPLDVDVYLVATLSDPALGAYMQNSGFWHDTSNDTWRRTHRLYSPDWSDGPDVCINRPGGDSIPAGDFTIELAISGVQGGNVGTTIPVATFHASGNAATVSFVDTILSVHSGESILLSLVSDTPNSSVMLSYGGTAQGGYDYYAENWVSFDAAGNGTLLIDAYYNNWLSEDLLIDIGFTGGGYYPGANPTAQVTITPPAPLSIGFALPTDTVDRYTSGSVCAEVRLNHMVYTDTTFDWAITGGTAQADVDYYGETSGQLFIGSGQHNAWACVSLYMNEVRDDVTLEFTISNFDGQALPATTTTTVTVAGGYYNPEIDFGESTYIGFNDINADQACIDVQRSGVLNGTSWYQMQATVSDPALGDVLSSAGWIQPEPGLWETWGVYDPLDSDTDTHCFNRMFYSTAPPGDHTISFAIVGGTNAHVGVLHPTTTLAFRQGYGRRRIETEAISGTTSAATVETVADGSATLIGSTNGELAGGPWATGDGRDVFLVQVEADATRWQVQFGSAHRDDPETWAVDENGATTVLAYASEGAVSFGYNLYGIDTNGVVVWTRSWPAGEVLGMSGGIAIVSDAIAGDISAIDAGGTTLWTLAPGDLGITGCSLPPAVGVAPIPGSTNWIVGVMPNSASTCVMPDVDGDTVVFPQMIAAVRSEPGHYGEVLWRVDDTAEVGGVAYGNDYEMEATTDAAGAIYLAPGNGLVNQLVKISAAGVPQWAASAPPCTGCTYETLKEMSVSANGLLATTWYINGTFGALPPLGNRDMGVATFDAATGAPIATTRLGSAIDDYSSWLFAADDGDVLLQMATQDGYSVLGFDGVSVVDIATGYSYAKATRTVDDNLLIYDWSQAAVTLHDQDFNML